jgi:AcrR family transcriptional regulator
MARKPTPGARERILDVASELFYDHGVHEVGLQQVIDQCGCGKNLLYREFPSKDDLVVAWLDRCRTDSEVAFDAATESLDDPRAQLLAVVRTIAGDTTDPGFQGCAIRNTHAEFHDPDHPVHQVSADYFRSLQSRLRRLAKQAGAADPDGLADRLLLVIDGLVTNSAILGPKGPATSAVALAKDIIDSATQSP